MLTFLILVSGLLFVVLFNTLFYRHVIKKAVKKYISPNLHAKGFELKDAKFTGLFNKGDFKNEKTSMIPIFSEGFPINNTYIYVYFNKKGDSSTKRVTAKIRTLFFSIRKVSFDPEL